MLCENVEWKDDKLMVTGYVRGAPISANRLVHVPGLGDFQVEIKGFGSTTLLTLCCYQSVAIWRHSLVAYSYDWLNWIRIKITWICIMVMV